MYNANRQAETRQLAFSTRRSRMRTISRSCRRAKEIRRRAKEYAPSPHRKTACGFWRAYGAQRGNIYKGSDRAGPRLPRRVIATWGEASYLQEQTIIGLVNLLNKRMYPLFQAAGKVLDLSAAFLWLKRRFYR